jgi:Ni/Co efflux regulator RcnB
MKKLITSALIIGAAMVAIPSMSVLAASSAPQDMQRANRQDNDRRDNDRNRKKRRERTTTTTRIVREGRFRYRETIETTYTRNGRTRTRVVSRVRIRQVDLKQFDSNSALLENSEAVLSKATRLDPVVRIARTNSTAR